MNKMKLTPYLEDIERRLNEADEQAILDAWMRYAHGEITGGPFEPPRRSPVGTELAWPEVHINDAQDDFDLMLLSQLSGCHRALLDNGNAPMMMRANYGVGNIASICGAKRFMMPREMSTLPNAIAIGEDGVRALLDGPEPELTQGNGGKILEMGERYAEIRRKYPKIARFVRIEPPDLQGPMDNCELLWGSDLFYALYDEPETVHALLRRMTDLIRRMLSAWYEILPNETGTVSYFGKISEGGIVIRNDSAMNLSPDTFDEFIRPYDSELLKAFGGGIIHFCGRGDHFIDHMTGMPGLRSVDMSQPHLNDMEKVLSAIPDQGINLFVSRDDFDLTGHQVGRIHLV